MGVQESANTAYESTPLLQGKAGERSLYINNNKNLVAYARAVTLVALCTSAGLLATLMTTSRLDIASMGIVNGSTNDGGDADHLFSHPDDTIARDALVDIEQPVEDVEEDDAVNSRLQSFLDAINEAPGLGGLFCGSKKRDCTGEWRDSIFKNGKCTASCGGGTKIQKWKKIKGACKGGKACPSIFGGRKRKVTCNTHPCPPPPPSPPPSPPSPPPSPWTFFTSEYVVDLQDKMKTIIRSDYSRLKRDDDRLRDTCRQEEIGGNRQQLERCQQKCLKFIPKYWELRDENDAMLFYLDPGRRTEIMNQVSEVLKLDGQEPFPGFPGFRIPVSDQTDESDSDSVKIHSFGNLADYIEAPDPSFFHPQQKHPRCCEHNFHDKAIVSDLGYVDVEDIDWENRPPAQYSLADTMPNCPCAHYSSCSDNRRRGKEKEEFEKKYGHFLENEKRAEFCRDPKNSEECKSYVSGELKLWNRIQAECQCRADDKCLWSLAIKSCEFKFKNSNLLKSSRDEEAKCKDVARTVQDAAAIGGKYPPFHMVPPEVISDRERTICS